MGRAPCAQPLASRGEDARALGNVRGPDRLHECTTARPARPPRRRGARLPGLAEAAPEKWSPPGASRAQRVPYLLRRAARRGAAAAAARCTHTERSPQVPGAREARCTGAEWSSGSERSPRKQSPGPSSHREPSSPSPSSLSSSFRNRHRQQQKPRERRRRLPRPGSAETHRAPTDPAAATLRSPSAAARERGETPREPSRPAGAAGICWRFLQ